MFSLDDGTAIESSITGNAFIMRHFSEIFGRASYESFSAIIDNGDGSYTANRVPYFSRFIEIDGKF